MHRTTIIVGRTPHQDARARARQRSGSSYSPQRSLAFVAPRACAAGAALLAAALIGCDVDEEAPFFPNGSGGTMVSPRPDGGGGEMAADSGAPLDGGLSLDPNVFRPEELAPTAEQIARLEAPSGFRVGVFAESLGQARMLVARGPHVYVTRPEPGDVLRLEDSDADGVAEAVATVAADLPLVHGIVFHQERVYLATDTQVLVADVDDSGAFGAPTVLIDNLPDGGQHPRRTLGVGPDDRLYISIGSSCDACPESNPEHATLLVAELDGSGRRVFASGLRNTIGFGWHPDTGQLWGMDHGSDFRGDDLPPEELNAITDGASYGWPYCYGDRVPDPIIMDPPDMTKAEYCAQTTGPALVTQAHSAPIGLTFYTGDAFPEEYRGDAFVAMRGSWNRLPPTGFKIVRLRFDGGTPSGFEDFVTGFLSEDGATTFARPAGVAVDQAGALLFSDDSNGVVYRVTHASQEEDAGAAPVSDAGGPGADGADAGVPDAG